MPYRSSIGWEGRAGRVMPECVGDLLPELREGATSGTRWAGRWACSGPAGQPTRAPVLIAGWPPSIRVRCANPSSSWSLPPITARADLMEIQLVLAPQGDENLAREALSSLGPKAIELSRELIPRSPDFGTIGSAPPVDVSLTLMRPGIRTAARIGTRS